MKNDNRINYLKIMKNDNEYTEDKLCKKTDNQK